ncbi:hypothetical protein DFA_03437 [Cavenderia fasciculata]|uniref:Cysteine proteinase n=1 Tax=Cavenderia fasciculata TaxID=261658 RepID=F4PHK5_CACFS|nr:uncharacterized protein DFA_03437 [Cavenderia fasciculata]EGG25189.1 hypothetical protein DFA_03437 [Cavenderia fasciculata]|eukprot:XP_004363040.1 hypothetical protein DFA_03437 [Cavenderia fasciculata]
MWRYLALIAIMLAVVSAYNVRLSTADDYTTRFKTWMVEHNKMYHEEEEFYLRLSNFIRNIHSIEKMNRQYGRTATFGLNKFSDLSLDEFKKHYLMPNYKPKARVTKETFNYPSNIPATLDWRTKGYVTPVKNQLMCGSCWAFSATEQIETANIMAGGQVEYLSEQQIVDCDPYDGGCGGGDPYTAYQYVQNNGGLTLNVTYPYTAANGACYANSTAPAVQVTAFGYASSQGNETQLREAMAARGPLSICVNAEPWMSYQSGIFSSTCSDDLDHCVQIVGYDTDATSKTPYFIVRNSWGTDWGLLGYIYIQAGSNLCGITNEVTYVSVHPDSSNTVNYHKMH